MMKLATTMVAVFFALNGLFAQDPADFVDAGATESYITIGKTMPFFVVPDPFYHPAWTPISFDLTTGFTWSWNIPAGLTLASQSDNYVTITADAVGGPYTVNVREQAPVALGGCADPTGTDILIRVVEAPELGSFPYFNVTLGIADGETYQQCGPMTGINPNVSLTGFPNFQVRFNLVQQEIDGLGADVGAPVILVDATVEANWFAGGSGNSLTRGTETVVFDPARDLSLIAGQRTKYTYTITGITDNISRKSDYLGAKEWYDATAQVYTIIVNPAPSTGPIFHIPNTFGNI